jgi:hypothetical protein
MKRNKTLKDYKIREEKKNGKKKLEWEGKKDKTVRALIIMRDYLR